MGIWEEEAEYWLVISRRVCGRLICSDVPDFLASLHPCPLAVSSHHGPWACSIQCQCEPRPQKVLRTSASSPAALPLPGGDVRPTEATPDQPAPRDPAADSRCMSSQASSGRPNLPTDPLTHRSHKGLLVYAMNSGRFGGSIIRTIENQLRVQQKDEHIE